MDGEKAEVVVRGSIEEAVGWVRVVAGEHGAKKSGEVKDEEGGEEKRQEGEIKGEEEKEEVKVLVTGSVHLVGGFLEVLEGDNVKGGT